MSFIDLTGQRFGRLTVIERAENSKSKQARWLCQCDCGNNVIVNSYNLRSAHTTSCGCYRSEASSRAHLHDLVGQRFGSLVVVERAPNKGERAMWLCQCDCGKQTVVRTNSLKSGNTTSCGHRRFTFALKHGMTGSLEYNTWASMIMRCTNSNSPHYGHYGGRGITVCKEWRNSFEQFYSDMGPRPGPEYTIDRIDNDKGYFKENCRWATAKEQHNNTRRNLHVTDGHSVMTLAQMIERVGGNPRTIRSRFALKGILPEGYELAEAVNE